MSGYGHLVALILSYFIFGFDLYFGQNTTSELFSNFELLEVAYFVLVEVKFSSK